MTKAAENGQIDLTSLLNDDNFVEYLEEMHITQETLLAESYERQYSIVSEFYNKVNTCAFDSYTA
jgi:hypothetical protein